MLKYINMSYDMLEEWKGVSNGRYMDNEHKENKARRIDRPDQQRLYSCRESVCVCACVCACMFYRTSS